MTPSKAGITFEPASRVYTDTQTNQLLQDFKAVVMVTNNADSGTGSLRQVLTDALAGATVRFDPSLAGQTITLASTLSVTKNITIDGSDLVPPVEISGNNAVRIFILGSSGGNATLQALVLKNGYVSGTNSGGAITVNGGSVTINGVTFIDNNAYNGGAIYSYLASVNLVIDQSEFISNDARNSGGAIYMQRSILTLRDSDLVGNTAVTGGAVHLYQGSPTVETSTFTTNTATNGWRNLLSICGWSRILRGNLFSGNTASSNGGAVRVTSTYSTYSVAIENNTFD